MIISVLSVILGICFFIVPLWAYRRGLKDGLALSEGAKTVEPIPTPFQVVEKRREVKAVRAEADRFLEGMNNIFSYDGTKQGGGSTD